MQIDENYITGKEAARRAGFKTTQAFYELCSRAQGAPQVVVISDKKRFIRIADFENWLRQRHVAA